MVMERRHWCLVPTFIIYVGVLMLGEPVKLSLPLQVARHSSTGCFHSTGS